MTIAPRAGGEETTVQARWIVDASGRSWILKRKLDLLEDNGHVVNSSWFRLAGGLNIEDWADPDDEEFFGRMSERGLRQFSTNHLCGKGYWMWMIPLSSGSISIGIVADPRFHAMDEMNTLDKSIAWIREHEPQLGEAVDARRDQVEDFLKVEDFSYGAKQAFSGRDRWCLVGEAGAFLDPFYSPGSDFIALSNTLATDLVTRELDGEDVVERAEAHDDFYLNAYRVHLSQYEGQYVFWDNPTVMNVKISGNNIYYWGCLALLFFHRKLTDLEIMAAVRPDMERMWAIITRLEPMYREWNELEAREWRRAMVPSSAFPAMFDRHRDMIAGFDDDALKVRMRRTPTCWRPTRCSPSIERRGTSATSLLERTRRSTPTPCRWIRIAGRPTGCSNGEGLTVNEARQSEAGGMENLLMEAIAQPA